MTTHAGTGRRSRRGAGRPIVAECVPAGAAAGGAKHAHRLAIAGILLAFAIAFSLLQFGSYRQRSAIWDEPVHLATGYAALARGDYRVEATHPPFIRMWAAVPLLFMDDIRLDTTPIDRLAPAHWHSDGNPYEFSTRFVYADNDADRLLDAARFMIVIWGIVLGILVFCWALEWLGVVPASCALLFYTLSPNLLAHASVVTTDMGITCFMFGTVYFLWRTCRRITAFNLAGLTLFFALAIVTKFSGLILGPIVALLLACVMGRQQVMTPRRAVAVVMLLAAGAFVGVWAVCGFQYLPSESPTWVLHLEDAPLAATVPTLARVTAWVDAHRLLPNIITEGFLMFAQSMRPPNHTFLAGAYSADGWWYYFPAAFLIKTPIPSLVLCAIGVFVCVRQRRELGGRNEVFVLLPVAVYLTAAILNTFQVGLRHILPLYPFLLLVVAAGTTALIRRPVGRVTLAGLAIAGVLALVSVYPYTLTFFNRFVGGPDNGYRYLSDSNVDWGQGLKLLKDWMDERGVSRIALAYFGTADPAYYGIEYTALPGATPGWQRSWIEPTVKPALPGYVAVGATVLSGVYQDSHWQLFYRGLRETTPHAVLGNSVFVYWLEEWPEPESPPADAADVERDAHRRLGDELMARGWPDHAVVHYRRYLEDRPGDPNVLGQLGLALASAGASGDAVPVLQRAIELRPDNGPVHLGLAAVLFDLRRHPDEVIAHARRASVLMPRDPEGYVVLARALAVGGRLHEAATAVQRALTLAPDDADAKELLRQIRAVAAQLPA